MNYNFMSNPIYPGQPQMQQNPDFQNAPFMSPNPPVISTAVGVVKDIPAANNLSSSYGFTIVKDKEDDPKSMMLVPAPTAVPEAPKRKRAPKKVKTDDIVKAEGEVVANTPTIDSYNQTSMMLEDTIQQLDILANDLKEELDSVRMNRNARNRTTSIANIGETLGSLLNSKISAIRELNSSISKSNDMDYKKEKDLRAAQASINNDDKHVMDLYNAMIHQSSSQNTNYQTLMPMQLSLPNIGGDSIVRAPIVSPDKAPQNGEPVDIGYLNYLSRISPEENAMFYEHDPNVQNVVVYDHATGKKFFQVMNLATGQVVPNVPTVDQRFMDDTYLDMKTMTARNSNMNTTYPIVEINKGVTSEY